MKKEEKDKNKNKDEKQTKAKEKKRKWKIKINTKRYNLFFFGNFYCKKKLRRIYLTRRCQVAMEQH